MRASLDCAARIMRAHEGEIRSFDGDRVTGVFIEGPKRSNAVTSAIKLKWATEQLIQKTAIERFASVRNNDVKTRQACGVNVGISRADCAGIRYNDDLI